MKLKDALSSLRDKELEVGKIEMVLDHFGPDDRIIETIKKNHGHRFKDASFARVVDIIDSLDLAVTDENLVSSKIDTLSLNNFYTLLINMKLSRLELIFFIKNSVAQDVEIVRAFGIMKSQDLIDITVRWRPKLFQGPLEQYISLYSIPQKKIDKYLERCRQDQKFKFLS